MFFNNTIACRNFLKLWIQREAADMARAKPERYGQVVLGETWHNHRDPELRTLVLPHRYCKVFDHPWKRGESGPVEVEHLQASRRLRNKVI